MPTIKHKKGSAGGYLVGRKHAQGGIKVKNNSDPSTPIEVEGGEVVITAPAVSDQTKHQFQGKMLTNRQILSAINESGGGVSFADGGDVPRSIKCSGKMYNYGGEMKSDYEIVKGCGCKHENGGTITGPEQNLINAITSSPYLKKKKPGTWGHTVYTYAKDPSKLNELIEMLVHQSDTPGFVKSVGKKVADAVYKVEGKTFADGGHIERKTLKLPDLGSTPGNSRYFQHFKRGGLFAKGGIYPEYNEKPLIVQAKGGVIEYSVRFEKRVGDDHENENKYFTDIDQAIDFAKANYSAVNYTKTENNKVIEQGGVDVINKKLVPGKSMAQGGAITGDLKSLIGKQIIYSGPMFGEYYKRGFISGEVAKIKSVTKSKDPHHGPFEDYNAYTIKTDRDRFKIPVYALQQFMDSGAGQWNDEKEGAYRKLYTIEKADELTNDWIKKYHPERLKMKDGGTVALPGIKKQNVREIELKLSDRKDLPKEQFTSSYQISKYLYSVWDKNSLNIQEMMYVLYLSQSNTLIGYQQLSKGGITGTVADVELIVATAVKALAKAVIISHNHPSGNLKPSRADEQLTDQLLQALKLVQIKLLDHIIVVPDEASYYSFADEGILSFARGGKVAAKSMSQEEFQEFLKSVKAITPFVPQFQIDYITKLYRSEEREAAIEIVSRLSDIIKKLPGTYATESQEAKDKIVYLHYFYGNSDWYIVEKDKGDPDDPVPGLQHQAFGFAELFPGEGEWGYISIEEIRQTNKIELDFYFEPKKFGALKGGEEDTGATNDPAIVSDIDKYMKVLQKFKDKSVDAYLRGKALEQYNENEENNAHSENVLLLAHATGSVDLYDAADYAFTAYQHIGHVTPEVRQLQNRVLDIIKIVKEKEFDVETHTDYRKVTATSPEEVEQIISKDTIKNKAIKITEVAAANKDRIIIAKVSGNADQSQQSTMNKGQQTDINNQIRELVKSKGADRSKYSADELALLKLYEGAGAEKATSTDARILDQFFTPMDICAKMWGLAFKHGFSFPGSNVSEPACGSGRFLQFIPADQDCYVRAYDVDEVAAMICKVLFPSFDVRHGSFEQEFFKGRRHVGMAGVDKLFDLVIGNPPYREYVSEYAPLGEKKATGATTFEMYFIGRGVDILKPQGLLVFIIPNTFLSNDKKYNDFKAKLAEKCELIDAYRLPNGVFGNTEVGTDIIVLRKNG